MKVIIDTNVLIAALLKENIVRKILLSNNITFLLPEYALEEIEEHKEELLRKSKLSEIDFKILLDAILKKVLIVHHEATKNKIREAIEIMKDIDVDDAPFIATALAVENDGLWSFDDDVKRQKRVKIFSAGEIIRLI